MSKVRYDARPAPQIRSASAPMRRLLSALAFLALASPLPAGALPAETWVVALANNQGDAGDVALLYAERDARLFTEVLQSQGGVAQRRLTTLVNASAQEARDTLLEVNTRIRERSSHVPTALVVYYSGHADATALHMSGTRLSLDELQALVQGSPASMRLLVLDACRSGSITRVKGVKEAASFELQLRTDANTEGLAVITSSAAGESSQESDELRGSFFTHHLVNGLRGAADDDADQRVTLAEAYGYAYSQTLRSSGRTMTLQHPTYAYDVKGKGELVLTELSASTNRLGRLRLAEPVRYVVSEGREGGPVVAEVAPAKARASLALNGGSYFVQQRLPHEYREYEVQLAPGAELSLEGLPYRALRYDRLVRKRGGEADRVHGLFVQAAVRGEVIAGEGVAPQLQLGYSLDLPWFTVGARVRGGTVASAGELGILPRRHSELALGLALQRFVDFPAFSMSFGLLSEIAWHRQSFEGTRDAPPRNVLGGSFGGILSFERHVFASAALRIEGGLLTFLHRRAIVHAGAEVGSELASPFTGWLAGGLVWRL